MTELPPIEEIKENSPEEDRYFIMKDFYKQGKQDAQDLYGTGVTGAEMAESYTTVPEFIQQYLNGWNYGVYLMEND